MAWRVRAFLALSGGVDGRYHVLSAAEPSFVRVWSRYKEIVAFDGLKVYKRGKGGCIDPWVAAEGPGSGTTVR